MGNARATGLALIFCTLAAYVHAQPALVAPGVVATGDSESHATPSPDGRSLYFVKLTPDFAHWTIVVARATEDGGWGEPAVAPFSGRWDDADVSFSPDGERLYFISNRPDGDAGEARPDFDIFRMRRADDGWTAPERVVDVASPGNEWYPVETANGTLYFGSERRSGNLGPEGTSDLWRARKAGDGFAPPENLGPVLNGAAQEIEAWVAPDETMLVYAAKDRADGLGSYDLYASRRCDGAWTAPRPLAGGVNTPGWEFGPRFSEDGATFYFGSNVAAPPATRTLQDTAGYAELTQRLRSPGNGLFDVYAADAAALALPDCPRR
jgi:hypothetical protein